MCDVVDIVIPTAAQSAAETLQLKVSRSVTTGVRIPTRNGMKFRDVRPMAGVAFTALTAAFILFGATIGISLVLMTE